MSRYIYIDADAFEVFGYNVPKEYDVESFGAGVACVLDKLDKQPTADVVEVVPCKDCKWNKSTPHNPICSNDDMPKDVGFFCADGERREDDGIH